MPAEDSVDDAGSNADTDGAIAEVDGGSDGDGDAATGSEVSGGPIADDWSRVCELLDAQTVAELFGVDAVSQVNGAGSGTALCQYGSAGEVQLIVTDPGEQSGISATDFLAARVDFERGNGFEVVEAPLMDLPRATWIADDGRAVTVVALEPYLVEMSDVAGQDIAMGVAIGGVLDSLR